MIEALSSAATSPSSAVTGKLDNELGKDAFLQLLVAQLKYQDPMNPMENTETIAQLAQFSSLEQMQNLNEKFDRFNDMTLKSSAVGIIGSVAYGYDPDTEEPFSGIVESVRFQGNDVFMRMGEKEFNIKNADSFSIVWQQ